MGEDGVAAVGRKRTATMPLEGGRMPAVMMCAGVREGAQTGEHVSMIVGYKSHQWLLLSHDANITITKRTMLHTRPKRSSNSREHTSARRARCMHEKASINNHITNDRQPRTGHVRVHVSLVHGRSGAPAYRGLHVQPRLVAAAGARKELPASLLALTTVRSICNNKT